MSATWRRRGARRPAAAQLWVACRDGDLGRDGRDVGEAPSYTNAAPHTREDKKWLQHAHGPTLSMDHPGCVERRQGYDGKCLFDGRFSLASMDNQTWLYARGNTNPEGGGRAVFVAQKTMDGWGRLKPIEFMKGARPPFDRIQRRDADVLLRCRECEPGSTRDAPRPLPGGEPRPGRYHDSRLLRRAPFFRAGRGPRSAHDRGEVVDHAVDGVSVDDGDAFIYIHAGVPGALWRTCEFSTMKPPPSGTRSRLTWPLAKLRGFSRGSRCGAAARGAM